MDVLKTQKKLFICEITTYIYEMELQERQGRLTRFGRVQRSGTFAQTAKPKFWRTFRGKPFLFKLGS